MAAAVLVGGGAEIFPLLAPADISQLQSALPAGQLSVIEGPAHPGRGDPSGLADQLLVPAFQQPGDLPGQHLHSTGEKEGRRGAEREKKSIDPEFKGSRVQGCSRNTMQCHSTQ